MKHFTTPTDRRRVADLRRAWRSIYFVFMMGGALGYRRAAVRLAARGLDAAGGRQRTRMITHAMSTCKVGHKTPQFWLVWMVLCMNVSAGIGVIGMAQPMLQEIFGGKLIGMPELGFAELDKTQQTADRRRRRRLRGAVQPVQHRGPLLLGLPVRQARPQG